MTKYKKIYLVGFMGSGKSTAGKKLAVELGWSFIDMDKEIEKSAGLSIPQIFSEHGEAHFRKIESRIIKELELAGNLVISTGGGAPCHDDNMSFMKKSGLTIYLKRTPLQLKSRLEGSKNERPLIKGLKDNDLLKYIESRLTERELFYNQADIITEGSDINYPELIKLIKEKI